VNEQLLAIDWGAPWLAPYRAAGERVAARVLQGASVAEALNAEGAPLHLACGERLRFVPQRCLPEGQAYEAFIAHTAQVPTRNNLHDFFNGLVWLTHPALKARLNTLQNEAIAHDGVGATRGPVRDALTLFDENAAWLHASEPLAQALRARDWQAAFINHRAAWAEARVQLFGHALLEKLVAPYKSITAHAWLLPLQGCATEGLLAQLHPEVLARKPHTPLPVLGVPGWWVANEAPVFYDDTAVFRPARC
jgi:hypothetical protein